MCQPGRAEQPDPQSVGGDIAATVEIIGQCASAWAINPATSIPYGAGRSIWRRRSRCPAQQRGRTRCDCRAARWVMPTASCARPCAQRALGRWPLLPRRFQHLVRAERLPLVQELLGVAQGLRRGQLQIIGDARHAGAAVGERTRPAASRGRVLRGRPVSSRSRSASELHPTAWQYPTAPGVPLRSARSRPVAEGPLSDRRMIRPVGGRSRNCAQPPHRCQIVAVVSGGNQIRANVI